MADEKQTPDSSPNGFHSFPKLPTEIRLRIWQDALDNATGGGDRFIRVTVCHRLYTTPHSCLILDGRFCQKHDRCERWTRGDPNRISVCMGDGYFAYAEHERPRAEGDSDKTPGVEDEESQNNLRAISLACHESRQILLARYPKALRVFSGSCARGAKSRLVRCDPTRDVLLIMAVPDLSNMHPHDGQSQDSPQTERDRNLDIAFLKDTALFSSFRDMVSSFEHVAVNYAGHRRADWQQEVATKADFGILLLFFESLRSLYLFPDPNYWPDVHEDLVRVEDIRSLVIQDNEARWDLNDVSDDVRGDYEGYESVQRMYSADSEEHWVPKPRKLDRIGCYAAASWLPKDGVDKKDSVDS